jgi:FKBP-type peptidyl-prolyl cis-trans isomerase
VGTRATIEIPADRAYGAQGLATSGIPADARLFFDIELRGVR